MKRMKKILTLVVAFAMTATVAATSATYVSHAAPVSGTTTSIAAALPSNSTYTVKDDEGTTHTITKAASVKVGETLTFSAADKIRTPKGKVVTLADGSYTFKEVGFYSLIVKGYEGLRIECVADDAELSVDAAAVPTYVSVGADIPLPTAKIVDSQGKSLDNNGGYTIETTYVTPSNSSSTAVTDSKIPASVNTQAGSYFVRYMATKGDLTLIKDFTVQSQTNFKDEEDPTFTITGMPNYASLRTKLTLPIATAKDNFDENVKITVTVAAPDGSKIYSAKEKNHVLTYDETEEVVFDNDKTMSFYPSVTGDYIVTYTAEDDAGNKLESRYSITVKDNRAPVLVVEEEGLIPSEWGLTTSNQAGVVSALRIPAGKAYDNAAFSDGTYAAKAKIRVQAPNSDYIYDETADETVNLNNCVVANADGSLSLDLVKAGTGYGTYTIAYKATDASKLSATKEYKVTVTDSYSVTEAPTIDTKSAPDFMVVGDKFAGLDTLGIKATAAIASTGTAANVSTVGTSYRFFPQSGEEEVWTIENGDSVLLTRAGTLKVTVQAKDAVGNTTTSDEIEIQILDFTSGDSDNSSFSASAASLNTSADKPVGTDRYDFFSNNDEKAMLTYTASANAGFEAYVAFTKASDKTDAVPSYVKSSIRYVEEENANGTKTVSILHAKIMDTVTAGTYTLYIRAFDQGYTDSVWSYSVTFAGDGDDGDIDIRPMAVKTASSVGNAAYQAQILKKYTITGGGLLGREITGSRYSVMGRYFVPMTSNETYTVNSYAVQKDTDAYRFLGKETESYTTVQTTDITFKIYDKHDIYYEKYAEGKSLAKVPEVSVVSPNGRIVEYKVTVTAPDGSEVPDTAFLNADGTAYDEAQGGPRYFKNTANGVYVVKVTAKTATAEASYEIKITSGDIVKPELTVDTEPEASVKKGATFKFSKLSATDNVTASDKIKFTRTLLAPDGTKVMDDELSTEGTEETTLDQVGDYTVVYTAEDEAGVKTTLKFTITVAKEGTKGSATQTVTIVLIVVVALLIVGLLIYFFVFRKIDLDKKKKGKKQSVSQKAKPEKASAKAEATEYEAVTEENAEEETSVEADEVSAETDSPSETADESAPAESEEEPKQD